MNFKYILSLLAAVALLSGCSLGGDDADEMLGDLQEQEEGLRPLDFDIYASRSVEQTRAAYDEDQLPALKMLRDNGFGVFAYEHEGYWSDAKSAATPNFMYHQKVEYISEGNSWGYSPLKYWPNVATHYVSFFAYAPYNASAATSAADAQGAPWVSFDVSDGQELLYAAATDQQDKGTDGDGQTVNKLGDDQKVKFEFKHGQARFRFFVQTVVDKKENPGEKLDNSTRVLINSIKVGPGNLYTKGKMSLENGSWNETSVTHSLEIKKTDDKMSDVIKGVEKLDGEGVDGGVAEFLKGGINTFNELPEGVTEYKRAVMKSDNDLFLVVPVAKDGSDPVTVPIEIDYDFIMRDPMLIRNDPQFFEIISNKIKNSISFAEGIKAGMTYNIVLYIGMRSVSVAVADVEVWPTGSTELKDHGDINVNQDPS